ncbi:hypothetical protein LTR85_004562 [Meristemomyces frigidus]|nr:hypothetical protein LTR85_004562 [Meristemomyces frigidus]
MVGDDVESNSTAGDATELMSMADDATEPMSTVDHTAKPVDDSTEPIAPLDDITQPTSTVNDTPPPPKMPTLLGQALAVIAGKGKGRGSLSQGDVAVILDAKDLAKTILLDSTTLARQVAEFVNQRYPVEVPSRDSVASSGGIRLLFVLERTGTGGGMPTLELMALDAAAPVDDVTVVSENTTNAAAKEVKKEPADNSDEPEKEQIQSWQLPDTNWARAYECFFRMMVNMPSISVQQVRMPKTAPTALPLLEGVVAIAERYDCVQTVGPAFKSLSSDWISNRTLYAAVAGEPARWLALAVKLESDLVYKEAFVHMAGQHPNFARPVDRVPEHVMASIVAQARELRIKRYEVDQQLLMTTLRVEKPARGKLGAVSGTVNQHLESRIYDIVNVWRDWLTEHMSYLHDGEAGSQDVTVPETALCDHPTLGAASQAECLTVAGFYRLLDRGGDAYLPAEEVIQSWNQKMYGDEFGTIRVNLSVLKAQAREMVGPLVRSSLQLAERERVALPYLTCVEVGKVPWASEEEEEDGDVEMED